MNEQHEDETQGGVEDPHEEVSKPPPKKGILDRLGLDPPTLILMLKGSLPPTIAIAIYQATPVARYFTNLGYLMPIVSVLSLAVLPRGKFIQTLALNVVSLCVGAGALMLILWSSLQARINTTPPGAPLAGYNSSQSAVCGIWLFFNIWLINLVRAKLPVFNISVVVYSILVKVGATQGTQITSLAAAEGLTRELLAVMLCGMGIAAGVSLLVVPISGRAVTFSQMNGAIGLLRKCVSVEKRYLAGLESRDMFSSRAKQESSPEGAKRGDNKEGGAEQEKSVTDRSAEELRDTVEQVRELGGKIHADLSFAKRDIAWGKLDAKDVSELYALVRSVYIPILGMGTIVDIFQRAAETRGWDVTDDTPPDLAAEKDREKHIWNEIMRRMYAPFAALADAMDQGMEHACLMLELKSRPKPAKGASSGAAQSGRTEANGGGEGDVEAQSGAAEVLRPGDAGFSAVIAAQVQQFSDQKSQILNTWARERNLASEEESKGLTRVTTALQERNQAQLYVLLYMIKLIQAAGEAVSALASFADNKVKDGTMSRSRLIFPSQRRLRRWLVGLFREQDSTGDHAPDVFETRLNIVYMGDGYRRKKDPEHLPPANAWQHFGDGIRRVSDFFASEESMFGLRVACATMTVGIVAFLQSSQVFFIEQRLVWAMIITALGMTPTSGQSIFGFLLRVGGTLLAMICAFVIWYVVDQKTPGVIVMLWLFTFVEYYFFIKFPRFLPAVLIAIVTQALIIGYELQVMKIGLAAAERTGQPFYPTYELAPYRLATVAGGSLVAFIWTVFPKPMTDRTWLRRDLSATLYLLANYFTVIHETLTSQLAATAGDADVPGSPAHQLKQTRSKIFGKLMLLIPSIKSHAQWQKWELSIGGRFPSDVYADIILRSTRVMDYLTLMSYAVSPTVRPEDKEKDKNDDSDRVWLDAMAAVVADVSPMHYTILSTLTLLSNALLSGHSLPPFLPLPKPWELTHQLLRLGSSADGGGTGDDQPKSADVCESELMTVNVETGKEVGPFRTEAGGASTLHTLAPGSLLDTANMEQRGYTEFAVIQVCGTLLCGDIEALVRAISSLVGVVDFSFRVDPVDDSETTLGSGTSGSDSGSTDSRGSRLRRRDTRGKGS